MKRVLFMLLLAICASPILAQNADSVSRLDSKTRSALNASDQGIYQLALRYNDMEVAKQKLYELLVRNPSNLRFAEALASLYFEMGEPSSAALVALDLLEENDKNTVALEVAAFSLEQLGALDKALPHFERLSLLTGDNFSLYKTAFIQYNMKKYGEAMNSANTLIKSSKSDEKIGFPISETETQEVSMKAAAINLKGMIYLEQGSKEDAKVAFEEAVQLEPEFDLAKENLQKAS